MRFPLAVVVSGVLVASLAVLALGGGASGSSKAPAKPGIAYGGGTAQRAVVWLRLSPNRRSIVNLHLDWSGLCTDGHTMRGMPEDLGVENGFPAIRIHVGRFSQTVPEQASDENGSGSERFTLSGTVTDAKVRGTFHGTVAIDTPSGRHYACSVGTTTFSAVN
jgi:hypothetical protein